MKNLNKKQSLIIAAAMAFFSAAAIFVYLKQLRIEMTSEAGLVAGTVINREQTYFNAYGEFIALEELPKSEALQISLEKNKYFTLMRIEVIEDTVILHARCTKGFFKGTELYAKYNKRDGMTEYEIREKTKIPFTRLFFPVS
ncbi:MAG: hypothetical protein FWH43_00640 [Endomicrobia bacterium]|nr:hypothetical protein [Endomicrobiia bacterium]